MKAFLGVATVSAAMIVAVACGRSEESKSSEARTTSASLVARASCDRSEESGSCEEYRNGTSFGLEKSLCEGYKGRFTMTPCSTRGMVGSCRLGEGEVKRYYDSRYTADAARADCESDIVRGKFDRS
jgi:hypothetical protein